MLPTITVVTPSYNQGDFLEQTILSVLSQNYPRLQYIVIDGGSTDCSQKIIERYASQLDYWISERDRGQSDALIKGFGKATGDVLGWVNSDDILYSGALLQIGETYQDNPGCIIAGNVEVFIEGSPQKSRIIRQQHLNVHDMVAIWTYKSCYSQPGVFFPIDAYIRSEGIDEALHQCMDHDLLVRMLRTHQVAYIDEIIAGARVHPKSKTCSQAGAQVAEAYQVSRKYWGELPYSTLVCRLLSLLGLGRCAIGRLYHWNPTALGPIILEMMSLVFGKNTVRKCV